jgi:hypothetical protein
VIGNDIVDLVLARKVTGSETVFWINLYGKRTTFD